MRDSTRTRGMMPGHRDAAVLSTVDERLKSGSQPQRSARSIRPRNSMTKTLWVALGVTCQGCAFDYTDTNGDRHAIGLIDVTMHPSAAPQTFAGDVVEITSIGLSIGHTAQGGYVTAGYNRDVTAALRDNALVLGNPIVALTREKQVPREDDQ